ncbi:MAG: hypothetical protein LAT82_04660 [Nanoarchaeota archaeon]|nr:hypothetical protein [Nanoarchaeota archaeon]
MENFRFNLMKGKIVEVIIQNMFECTDYQVFSYGHENTLGYMKNELKKYKKHNDTLKKIRFTPDFVIYNPKTEETRLIEVKYNNSKNNKIISDFEPYQKYWSDCYILVVNPSSENVYFIQKASEIEIENEFYNKNLHKKVKTYDLNKFKKIQEEFEDITWEVVKDTFEIIDSLKFVSEGRKSS